MEEVDILTRADQQRLLIQLEQACGIVLPHARSNMGALSFHVYRFKDRNPGSSREWAFQIRWGVHKILSDKNLCLNEQYLPVLMEVIKIHHKKIKQGLWDYAESQLNTIISLELEPELNRHRVDLVSFQLKVCKARQKVDALNKFGWPNFCVALSWYDELGDFQEFIYPLSFDPEKRCFVIPTQKLVREFLIYRDSAI